MAPRMASSLRPDDDDALALQVLQPRRDLGLCRHQPIGIVEHERCGRAAGSAPRSRSGSRPCGRDRPDRHRSIRARGRRWSRNPIARPRTGRRRHRPAGPTQPGRCAAARPGRDPGRRRRPRPARRRRPRRPGLPGPGRAGSSASPSMPASPRRSGAVRHALAGPAGIALDELEVGRLGRGRAQRVADGGDEGVALVQREVADAPPSRLGGCLDWSRRTVVARSRSMALSRPSTPSAPTDPVAWSSMRVIDTQPVSASPAARMTGSATERTRGLRGARQGDPRPPHPACLQVGGAEALGLLPGDLGVIAHAQAEGRQVGVDDADAEAHRAGQQRVRRRQHARLVAAPARHACSGSRRGSHVRSPCAGRAGAPCACRRASRSGRA